MLTGSVFSRDNVLIRLTAERFLHITTAHPEIGEKDSSLILSTVSDPQILFKAGEQEYLAVRKYARKKKWIVVVYKESPAKKDGFIITAYTTTDYKWLLKRQILWNKK